MNATVKSTDLTELYDFRVSNGKTTEPRVNRYQSAQKLATWLGQGYTEDELTAEKRVNGSWQHDPATIDLAKTHAAKRAEKSNGKVTPDKSEVNIKSAMRELSAALRLAQSAGDNATEAHFTAVRERMTQLDSVLEEEGY